MTTFPAPISTAPTTTAVADAHLPPAVRDGAPGAKQAYETAQSFEEMLLGQLSQSLMQSSGLAGEGEGESGEAGASSDGAGGMLTSLLPQTLTEGVMRAGGLGLAAQLVDVLDPSARGAGAGSGGTPATVAPPPVNPNSPAVASTGGVSA
ncbi:MAG TPA: hypothetical protein VGI76_05865 [Solirubrobacteraceae bacterium]|jgi:Rod binding domain-containing protein